MTQKVLQIGSSAGVTIAKEVLKNLGLKVGDRVSVEVDPKRGGLVVLPIRRSKVNTELIDWTDEMIEKYRPALEALAKK